MTVTGNTQSEAPVIDDADDPIVAMLAELGYLTESEAAEMTGLPAVRLRWARLYGLLDKPLKEDGRPDKDDRGYLIGSQFGDQFIFPAWNVHEFIRQNRISHEIARSNVQINTAEENLK